MPNIAQVEVGNNLALNPTERGVEAAAGAARRINGIYSEVAQAKGGTIAQLGHNVSSTIKDAGDVAVEFVQHREISHGAAAYATMFDDLTNQWNDTVKKADPNDPGVAAKFRAEVLEPKLDEYKKAFMTEGGQKYAEERIASTRNHMFEKTSADMATLAADSVSVNVRTMANRSSNTAMNDPSTVPELLSNADQSVQAMVDSSPNLKGPAAARARMQLTAQMRENVVKAGAIGAIQKSPDPERTAQEWGAKYPEYINGAELKQLSANARQQIRADRTDELYRAHLKREQKQDVSDAAESDYIKKLYSGDDKQMAEVTAKAIANDDRVTLAKREHLIGLVEREMKPETEARASARNVLPLLEDINRPVGDPKKMTDTGPLIAARTSGQITRPDFNEAMKQFTEARTAEGEKLSTAKGQFLKGYEGLIDTSVIGGRIDAPGRQNYYKFQYDLNRAIEQARKDNKDPYSLFDPESKDFFGTQKRLQQYQRTVTEEVRDKAERLTRKVAPAPLAPDTKAKLDGIFGGK